MNQQFFQLFQWFRYWLLQVDEHSLQPPGIYDFYTNVIKAPATPVREVEKLRNTYLNNRHHIEVLDLGAGSSINNQFKRSIQYITKTSSSSLKFSSFLFRVAQYMDARFILELGTSFGFNTMYFAQKKDAQIVTMEGSPVIAHMANKNFKQLGYDHVDLVIGNIDKTLNTALSKISQLDLVYMDANHTYEATLDYFNQLKPLLHPGSIVVIDDIHWSRGMNNAWKELITNELVTMSVDLFDAGIIFFEKGMTKNHYIINF